MKKLFLFAMTAATMLFTACSNDDSVAVEVNGDDANVQRIVLAVDNSGSGMQTRAGRELLSSEAKQSIENVKVIITKQSDNTIVFTKEYTDWNNTESTAYTSGGHGRQAEIVLSGADKLAAGSYHIYAIGYSEGSQYTIGSTQIKTELAKYLKTAADPYDKFTANTVLNVNGTAAEEIFAGYNALTVSGSGVKTTVVLHRQVAGVFVYVDEIPFVTGAAKLSLYASNSNSRLILGNFLPANGTELTANGGNTNNKVVNGYTSSDAVTKVLTTNLSSWFSSIAADANNLIDATNWISAGHTNFNNGSVFMGNFLTPFRRYAGRYTFVLKLEDSSDNALRTWNIKLPSADLVAGDIHYWDGSAWATTSTSATVTEYNIYRNHLYGVGVKATNDPSDPGADDDPQTLNTKEDLVLKVNDNWEVIHTMEIE